MIEQRKNERGSQIDGGTTTENAFLGYLAIMLCCKTKVAYREVAYSESVGRISANKCRPARQRLLPVDTLQDKGCLQWILPTEKPYPDRGWWATSGAGQPTSAPCLSTNFNLSPPYDVAVMWPLDEVLERRSLMTYDRAEN
ncbi:uncharacterized protein DS421_20g696100 [Arachis hypogaea]|nr:uncharacterized protein DS421_20g696100 [Arachis hypogaea]